MGLFSFIGSCVSGVASFVGGVVRTAVGVAGKALGWIARTGEKVIKTVKKVWHAVRPYVEKISMVISAIADHIPIPAVRSVVKAIGTGLQTLLALEKSPILQALDKALKKVLPMAEDLGRKMTDWAEIREAKARQETFEEASRYASKEPEKRSLMLAQLINRFMILNSEVALMIKEDKVSNLEEYLQLRAAGKVLKAMAEKWNNLKSPEELTEDDLFMLDFSSALVHSEEVSTEQSERFVQLVQNRFGRPLLSIVFEEMVAQWAADLCFEEREEKMLFDTLNKKRVILKRYERMLSGNLALEPEEVKEMETIRKELPSLEAAREEKRKAIGHRSHYIEAAQGLLLSYEGDEALAAVVGNDFVQDIQKTVPDVAEVIIQCMERGRQWEELDADSQSMIMDFSNIFRKSTRDRYKEMVEVCA